MKSPATSLGSVPTLGESALQNVNRTYLLAALLAVAALCAMPLDLPITTVFRDLHDHGPGDLKKAITVFEFFGHGIGAAIIILATFVLDPRSRSRIAQLAVGAYGAGVVNFGLKVLVGRTRPQVYWDNEMPQHWSNTFASGTIWPNVWHGEFAVDHAMQSFPSGHSALAAGLATGLALFYPQGRYFFAFIALMAMLQRVHCGAHYPSDTLAGAAVGVAFAATCLDSRLLGRWLVPRRTT